MQTHCLLASFCTLWPNLKEATRKLSLDLDVFENFIAGLDLVCASGIPDLS